MAEKPVNRGRSTEEAGYQAVNRVAENTDFDASWRNKTINSGHSETARDVVADVQAREMSENQRLRESYRKIKALMGEDGDQPAPRRQAPQMPRQQAQPQRRGGLSMDDLMEGLTQEDLQAFGSGFEQFAGEVAGNMYTQGYGEPDEATMMMEEMHSAPRSTGGSWTVEKASAKLKSGAQIPVWLVSDSVTGMEIKKPFRIQEAAQRIASILNQSGNVNDPRMRAVMEAYDKHIELMKQIRTVKKQIQEGQTNKKGRLLALREQLEQVNYKLGI